ncbi:ABC transporter substrate-binding protein [Tranquillimonas alkanivorans]|uniref:Amino acid/amide ABC transporter substrate-binding protein, HAAT family n=1 Tax=Tranquillimonas alkanivorans TaxID=441119 RepID=A0A1I5WGM2_9RHOB|nr:ABC transporter substrate-binding protein [Tranquillimonas alkanivorans]SFQ18718.1 amino acid/amide ABC transporter substrate-binding protein, HAAT family [Tranquillimonas alkanivorans]
MKLTRRTLGLTAMTAALMSSTALWAQEDLVLIGGLATLEGPFAEPGEDGLRGVELAIAEFGNEIAGTPIEMITASSDGNPDVALESARRLVEQDGVDILVGPLSGSEGIRLAQYAKERPETTFLNGGSAAIETTLVDPAPNFYRFNTEGAQWTAPLGEYVVNERAWDNVIIVSEDYSFPYAQIFGFMATYCEAGGTVEDKFFTPVGTNDYSSVIAQLPLEAGEVDGMFVVLGGSDAVNFLSQYAQMGGQLPIIGGTNVADQTVLTTQGPARRLLPGILSAGPVSDNADNETWLEFVAQYQDYYGEEGLPTPSIFAYNYYTNTKAALLALQAVEGDLSNNHEAFRQALDELAFESPTGPVSINENRQATAAIYINEVVETQDGDLRLEPLKRIENVDQFLTLGEPVYSQLGLPSRDNPSCPS